MGHWALRLDYVRCLSYFGAELFRSIRDAEIAAIWKPRPHRTRHTPNLRDWRDRGRNVHNRSNAVAPPALHTGYTSRDIWHESVGTSSVCSPAHKPQPGPEERRMECSEASSTLDRWLTPLWLFKLCGVLSYFCVFLRTGC